MNRKKGILFDLDGVLTDTAEYHYLAWKRLADELGLAFDQRDNERLKGVDRLRCLDIILELGGADRARLHLGAEEKQALAARKNRYYQELIAGITPADLLPGIPKFLESAGRRGLRTAVASASRNAPFVLRRLGLERSFDYVADAAAVARAKPDPEIFLVCARALGFEPEACIGIEDSQAGIQAIRSAGMFSVGIHVSVTCCAPDLALASTAQLDLERILAAAETQELRKNMGVNT